MYIYIYIYNIYIYIHIYKQVDSVTIECEKYYDILVPAQDILASSVPAHVSFVHHAEATIGSKQEHTSGLTSLKTFVGCRRDRGKSLSHEASSSDFCLDESYVD